MGGVCRKFESFVGNLGDFAPPPPPEKVNFRHCPVFLFRGVHPLAKVKFKDFPGLSRPFFSKFKDLNLGKIFENGMDLP